MGVNLPFIHFVSSPRMGFRRKLFHIICVIYLFMITCLLAQDNPCASTSADEVNGVCGLNGICQVSGQSHKCSCAPGFHFVDTETQSKGCTQRASQLQNCGTTGAKMVAIEQIDWSGNDYQEITSTNKSACQEACIDDCFCTVAIYADLDDGGHCWKKAMPLRNGGASPTRTSFVKVYSGASEAVPPPPPNVVTVLKENKGKGLAVVGISLMGGSLVVAAIVLFVWLLICRPKMRSSKENHKVNPMGLKAFSYQELEAATGGFKIEIGRGAFGTVYKGVLSDGRAIAVKRLDDQLKRENNTRDGEKEFRTEVGIIGASHHKNLVQLYGFCDEGSHRILVYEYMPYGSLDSRVFKGTNGLDWELRIQILLGTARGILYLHEECRAHIIHCDIKPQNILLDENYCAKISDFGISKLLGVEQTRTFTLARGTMGYMAPEWQKSTAVSVKVDVYSFGVVLLEVICCRKMLQLDVPDHDQIMLSDWVYICLKRGRLAKLVEQQECTAVEAKQLERMVLVGLWCVQEDPSLRPSITRVVQMLEGTVEIPVPPNPGSSLSHSVNINVV